MIGYVNSTSQFTSKIEISILIFLLNFGLFSGFVYQKKDAPIFINVMSPVLYQNMYLSKSFYFISLEVMNLNSNQRLIDRRDSFQTIKNDIYMYICILSSLV